VPGRRGPLEERRAEQQVLTLALDGVAPGEAGEDLLEDRRLVPELGIAEQAGDLPVRRGDVASKTHQQSCGM
jgi:hypothetical protein